MEVTWHFWFFLILLIALFGVLASISCLDEFFHQCWEAWKKAEEEDGKW